MSDNKYSLTEKGFEIMTLVPTKAELQGLVNVKHINKLNMKDYIQDLANADIIWDGSGIEGRDEKLAMLAFALGYIAEQAHNNPTAYN